MSQQTTITPLLPAICASLAKHPRLVLEAPPGSGKTTGVPPALLDAPWLAGQKILMLEPRRIAARSAAGYMAAQMGEDVGATVGYRIRNERRVSALTRIEVVTEGILTRMLQDDPTLEGIGALLFDEFHERHLHAELGLALALDVQGSLRPDLRIVLMSATLDGERLAQWLDAPRIVSAGRAFAVAIEHFATRREERLSATVRRAVAHALDRHPGDLLVFLPGAREIAFAAHALSGLEAASGSDLRIVPLHGELPVAQQATALARDAGGARRVVLATNVAESSVTLPGVRVVIDSGLAREPRLDPGSGFSRLATVNIAQDSATQRAGRAGREEDGWCYRLWPASTRLAPARRAEIEQVELSGFALELAAWGSDRVRFLTPPPAGALASARDLLARLGLTDSQARITVRGRRALSLGTTPRLAAMMLAAETDAQRTLAADLAALIEARDPLRDAGDDLPARWRALSAQRHARSGPFARVEESARAMRTRLAVRAKPEGDAGAHEIGLALAYAFPDRIARVHPDDPQRMQLANGRSARLDEGSVWRGETWLVISDLSDATGDARVRQAAPLSETDLRRVFAARLAQHDRVEWDDARACLVAERLEVFDAIVLARSPLPRPAPEACAAALAEAVARRGLSLLPWSDHVEQWRTRVECLRAWFPQDDWPDFSDTALLAAREHWLLPLLHGKTRLDAVDSQALGEALRNLLGYERQRRLDVLAPRQLRLPSGRDSALHYVAEQPPVLACKLQELFGLGDTPRVADGRVAVSLHLLSPAGRPLQITQDLRGFWDRTWPEVRREMQGRYPRHPWPEDPWTATATHRTKPRRG